MANKQKIELSPFFRKGNVMAKLITVINGSPREGGNTDAILEKLMEGARSNALDIRYFKLQKQFRIASIFMPLK